MHELGLCSELYDTLLDLMEKEHLSTISSVTLTVGEATAVVPNYMNDCWPAVVEGSKLEGCKLNVIFKKAMGRCHECEKEYVISDFHGHCPYCGCEDYDMLNGYEFEVTEVIGH